MYQVKGHIWSLFERCFGGSQSSISKTSARQMQHITNLVGVSLLSAFVTITALVVLKKFIRYKKIA